MALNYLQSLMYYKPNQTKPLKSKTVEEVHLQVTTNIRKHLLSQSVQNISGNRGQLLSIPDHLKKISRVKRFDK